MKLTRYGVTLRRIQESDIELVRLKRNELHIRERMAYQNEISTTEQIAWFNSINNKHNYYFIINYKGEDIGVINAKNIDEKSGIGEGGIFVWKQEAWETGIPSFASIVLLDFVFNVSKFSNKSCIRILKDNKLAISFNKALGYVLLPYQDDHEYQWYILIKEDYEPKAIKYRKLASKLSNDFGPLMVEGAPSEKHLGKINDFLQSQLD